MLAMASPLAGDVVMLADGAWRLTGDVRAIDAQGVVELASPLSPGPLRLNGHAVEKVTFGEEGALAVDPPAALVELSGGDLLPVTIEGLDEKVLTVDSPEAGRLAIPREHVASIQLGVRRLRAVYAGPRALEEWTGSPGDPRNWSFEDATLIAKGQATAAAKFALPRKFVLRFTLGWEAREVPNFQCSFADPLSSKGEARDRYYLQFNGAGLEIKREASKGGRYSSIVQLNRAPGLYPDRRLQVELRVDRTASRMRLFLNGEPEGEFVDHVGRPPSGSGIVFVCNAQGGGLEIRDIAIEEFDDARARHHSEERGDPGQDALISREDDRWSGRLLDIRKTGGGAVFRFKSDFQEVPLEVPEAEVSTVFLSPAATHAADGGMHSFVLRLRGEGSLRVSSCRFDGDTVNAAHPLLGPVALRREGVVSLERTVPAAVKPETPPGK
jgi:hypothetical protein